MQMNRGEGRGGGREGRDQVELLARPVIAEALVLGPPLKGKLDQSPRQNQSAPSAGLARVQSQIPTQLGAHIEPRWGYCQGRRGPTDGSLSFTLTRSRSVPSGLFAETTTRYFCLFVCSVYSIFLFCFARCHLTRFAAKQQTKHRRFLFCTPLRLRTCYVSGHR